jgi:general secretion pathway protein C
MQVKPIGVPPVERRARHFLEGAVLASASLLAVTSGCPWGEAEVVKHDGERRRSPPRVSEVREPALHEPEAGMQPGPAPVAEASPPGPTPPAASLASTHATALPEPSPDPVRPAPAQREPAACTGPVRLTGSIVVAGQPEHSLAALSKGQGTSLLRLGQTFDGLQLAALRPRRAYMREPSGAYCTLHLLPSAQPARRGPPPDARKAAAKARTKRASPFSDAELSAAIRPAGGDRYIVSRAFAKQALTKLAGARGLGRFTPYVRDGRSQGLRVYGVKRDSPLARLGLRNGDVMRTLNGISLGSLDGFLNAYPLLDTAPALSLSVLRKNQPRTLEYTLE